MMMERVVPFAGILSWLMLSSGASAEVLIKDVHWHLPAVQDHKTDHQETLREKTNSELKSIMEGQRTIYEEARSWPQPPAPKLTRKPRAIVTLINRGPNPAEGVLLRYSVSARLLKQGAPADAGIWTVPFWIEELRVPWLKPNEIKEIPVDNMLLATYLKKTFKTGYWPNAIRIRVMVEPRSGEDMKEPVEQVLPLAWESQGGK